MGGLRVPYGLACENPVYQYAIQRWKATPYELLLFEPPQGGRSSEFDLLKEQLLVRSAERAGETNFHIVTSAEVTDALWQKLGEPTRPSMAIALPLDRPIEQCVFWQGALTESNVRLLLDSPSRQAIREELLDGVAVVWLLIHSGDSAKDKAALATIRESIEEFKVDYEQTEKSTAPPIAIQSIDRDDPAEAIFISILSHVETGLDTEADKPIAIPIYGRGRALYALVGDGINTENVVEACKFITGPCACDAKNDNPGVDLLIACRWDEELERRQTFDDSEETPIDQPLVGLSTLVAKEETTKEDPDLPREVDQEKATPKIHDLDVLKGQFKVAVLVSLGVAIVCIGSLTLYIVRRKQA